ncbi:MAG: BadF/BadG/BcrA/BcrD ATPase family protein [Opitutaceae bacterium]
MHWFIGIDGGGTHTRALIVNGEGQVLGLGKAGSSNYHTVGITRATQALAEAVAAARSAGHVHGLASGAFLGLAGVRTAADHLAFREPLADLGLVKSPERVGLDHDLRIALAGGCGDQPGIVVIAGTGSAAYGRDRQAVTAQAGGWGWLIDDQGGGTWFALQGLKAVMEATDGRGPRTKLEPAIFAELGVTSARDAMLWTMRPDTARSQLAALAPVILAAAEDGDKVAVALMREGAHQLARMAAALDEPLDFGGGSIPVVPAGGLLSNPSYLEAFRAALNQTGHPFQLVKNPAPPIAGAAFLAADLGGMPLSPEARRKLGEAARTLG